VLDHGRSRLLFVGDPEPAPDISERYAGFVAAHAARGLVAAEPVRVPFREREGAAVADRILAGELDADALVCANDELALSIMAHLQDAGLDVPGDIAVVGWDDVMTSRYVRPGMTTVRQPVHELGVLAAERLHQRVIGTPALPAPVVLQTEVVLRGSCGCPAP
jgi:LacI family transcriptional regulator